MIRGRGVRLRDCCLCDIFLQRRGGHIVDMFWARSPMVKASVLRVETLDVRVWQVQLVGIDAFQKTCLPIQLRWPITYSPMMSWLSNALSGPKHVCVSTPKMTMCSLGVCSMMKSIS